VPNKEKFPEIRMSVQKEICAKMISQSPLDKYNEKSCATSVKIKVLKKMLSVLRENGYINRTNLAGQTGLNYNNCIKYLNLMQLLGWVEMIYDNAHYMVITERGIDILERFVDL